jgi:hypothetical protein
MFLYKFKSLRNFDHVLDILLNERLHCAFYKDLNDPFEGIFWNVFGPAYIPSLTAAPIVIPRSRKIASIDDFVIEDECKNICSLSALKSDARLWSYYADNHKGIAIEIDFTGIEGDVSKVKYFPNLPEGGTTLLAGSSAKEILSYKTTHWQYEEEYRIIYKDKYFPILKRIIAIYLGPRISESHIELLMKVCPKGVTIFRTKLNHQEVTIDVAEQLSE